MQPLADNYVGNGGFIQPERCHSSSSSSSSSSSEHRQAVAAAVAAAAVDIGPSPSAAPEVRAGTPFHRLCTLCLLLPIFYSAISAAASSCLFPTIALVDFLALMNKRLGKNAPASESASAPAPAFALDSTNFVAPAVDIDIDDGPASVNVDEAYCKLAMVPLNLPVHIVSQIQEWFGRKPAESVQAYHYKSDRLNDVPDVEWSRFYVLLKYAKQSKYLIHDSIKGDSDSLFVLQGGTTQHLQQESTTASHFARRCYDIFTVFKRKESFPLDSVIILPEPVQLFVQQTFKAPTVQSAVTSYCYAKREQNFVRLPASWSEDGTEFASIYPSLRDWKTGFQGDFSKMMTVRQFNSSILGDSMNFLSPSEVKASQAWQCLTLQTSNDWTIEIPGIDAKKTELSSMGLDFDYGLG